MSILWYNTVSTGLRSHEPRSIKLILDADDPTTPKNKVQVRSRGRHEPGSGPYENRIAIGGSVTGTGAWADAYFSITHLFEEADRSASGYYAQLIHWSGGVLTRVYILGPSQLIPATDNHWRIRWSTEYIDLATLSPQGRYYYGFTEYYTDTYSLNSYYRDFPDSWEGAVSAAYRVAGDYTYGGRYPRAYQYHSTRSSKYDYSGDKNVTGPKLSPRFGALRDLADNELNAHMNAGFANAYVDACTKLPHTAGMNNIANTVQVLSSLKKFLSGRLSSVGSLTDAWLGYRYEYSTTVLDIEEASALWGRLKDIALEGIKCLRANGYYKSGEYTYRCSLTTDAGCLGELQSFAEKWGVKLSGYNIWDMIPYSFVVDWFVDVGGLLERWEAQDYAYRITPTSCWYSVQVQGINEYGCLELDYYRFQGAPRISAADLDWVSSGPSGVTIVKRAADVACLLF